MQKIKRGNACATEVKAWGAGEEKDSRRSISSQKRRRRRSFPFTWWEKHRQIFFAGLHQIRWKRKKKGGMLCQLLSSSSSWAWVEALVGPSDWICIRWLLQRRPPLIKIVWKWGGCVPLQSSRSVNQEKFWRFRQRSLLLCGLGLRKPCRAALAAFLKL